MEGYVFFNRIGDEFKACSPIGRFPSPPLKRRFCFASRRRGDAESQNNYKINILLKLVAYDNEIEQELTRYLCRRFAWLETEALRRNPWLVL